MCECMCVLGVGGKVCVSLCVYMCLSVCLSACVFCVCVCVCVCLCMCACVCVCCVCVCVNPAMFVDNQHHPSGHRHKTKTPRFQHKTQNLRDRYIIPFEVIYPKNSRTSTYYRRV